MKTVIGRFLVFIEKLVNQPKRLVLIFLAIICASALQYSYMEGRSFFDGLWWTIVTACTVGYGDQYPVTIGGRMLASPVMIITIFFIVPLITAQLASKLIVDRDQWSHEEQEDLKTSMAMLPEAIELMKRILGEVDDVEEQGSLQQQMQAELLGELRSIRNLLENEVPDPPAS